MSSFDNFAVGTFILGLIIGSFLSVCIYRIPRGESVVFPPSHCPSCNYRLAPLDLIPLASFLLLRGRCRNCDVRISSRYMYVELLTGFLFTICYLKAGLQFGLVKYLIFTALLVVVAFIDLEHYIVPNKLVLFGLGAGAVFLFFSGDISYASALLGVAAGSGFLLLSALVSRGGLGGGDIKLAAVIGLFLGWPLAPLSIFLGCCLAGLVGLFLILTKKKKRKDIMPLVPFLAAGSCITMLWGWDLLGWYLKFLNI